MKVSGWGRYPVIESKEISLSCSSLWKRDFIPKGNLRSYGDSALSEIHTDMLKHNKFLSFDQKSGILSIEAGVLLSEIIEVFLPKGWFLGVVPGTKFITIGGAIASDIHGKNHHKDGCFSNFVESFKLQISEDKIVDCSRNSHLDLFESTCGGMGLTGIIKEVSIRLHRVSSKNIVQQTFKCNNLKETFNAFEENSSATYSVAWIDCLQKKNKLGRSLVMTGEFCNDNNLKLDTKKKFTIPFYFPSFFLSKLTVKLFNFLYFNRVRKSENTNIVDFENFFFPLDSINNWNKIYGNKGFFQFQFILPKKNSYVGMRHVLEVLAENNAGSFLAVLKLYGKENNNLLSFPMNGYSLALDFKNNKENIKLVSSLTDYIIGIKGRVYLTKDSVMTYEQFNKSYKNIAKFKSLREKYNLNKTFVSLQSKRLLND